MDFQDVSRELTILQARMHRMEAMMQQLLAILSSSNSEMDRHRHLQALSQELRGGPTPYPSGMGSSSDPYASGYGPTPATPGAAQEPPQMQAIRAAMMAGDKIKAIKLYRELYGVDLKTAQDALSRM